MSNKKPLDLKPKDVSHIKSEIPSIGYLKNKLQITIDKVIDPKGVVSTIDFIHSLLLICEKIEQIEKRIDNYENNIGKKG